MDPALALTINANVHRGDAERFTALMAASLEIINVHSGSFM